MPQVPFVTAERRHRSRQEDRRDVGGERSGSDLDEEERRGRVFGWRSREEEERVRRGPRLNPDPCTTFGEYPPAPSKFYLSDNLPPNPQTSEK